MNHERNSESLGFRGVAIIASAIGAVAVGAFAIGALAVGRMAIRQLVIENAKFKTIESQDLSVKRLRAAEVTVSASLRLPSDDDNREIRR
jgi:hypothetical protein